MGNRIRGVGDDITVDVVLLAGVGLAAYFLIIKPGLNLLNPPADPVIAAQMAIPGPSNPFSYQFQPFIDFYNNNTPVLSGGSGASSNAGLFSFMFPVPTVTSNNNPTIQQFFQFCKANPGTASPWGFLDSNDLSNRAENLNNALSVSSFNPLSMSDQTGGMSALSGFSNQLQMAFIANYFWWNFNTDLLTFLNGSLGKAGLTNANLDAVINTINSLPVNPS